MTEKFINGTIKVFNKMVNDPSLRPTARKFHYQFNLRDFSKIIKNLMLSTPNNFKNAPEKLARLWIHECNRVYMDRLLFDKDIEVLQTIAKEGARLFELNVDEIFKEPNIFTSFISVTKGQDKQYLEITDLAELKKVLEDKLAEYQEAVAAMNLVLF
jgi:dynein heavy chain, axonemal